ncbi:hypothetical protein [Anaerofustis stercorihominis]|uniref:hypothetical protein n=1 Tax=Anaerofustis stercorihominis TaxID=214853 RepID=UPI0026731AC2|nr:hypothetical protein [Anaerofustis stercorihominis]
MDGIIIKLKSLYSEKDLNEVYQDFYEQYQKGLILLTDLYDVYLYDIDKNFKQKKVGTNDDNVLLDDIVIKPVKCIRE